MAFVSSARGESPPAGSSHRGARRPNMVRSTDLTSLGGLGDVPAWGSHPLVSAMRSVRPLQEHRSSCATVKLAPHLRRGLGGSGQRPQHRQNRRLGMGAVGGVPRAGDRDGGGRLDRCGGGRHWTRTSDLLHVKYRHACIVALSVERAPFRGSYDGDARRGVVAHAGRSESTRPCSIVP